VGTDEPPKRRATRTGESIAESPASKLEDRATTEGGETIADKAKRAETESDETIADKPGRAGSPRADSPAGRAGSPRAESAGRAESPREAGRAPIATGMQLPEPDFDAIARTPLPVPRSAPATATGAPTTGPSTTHGSLTTVAEAMHAEEVRRTRQFIAIGWAISLAAIGAVPVLDAPRYMSIAMVVALAWGIVMSSYFYRRFADPTKYSENQMIVLGALATINTHVAIFYFGTFTAAPVIIVFGMHFVARSEAVRGMRILFAVG
jgi:hypothetical protein